MKPVLDAGVEDLVGGGVPGMLEHQLPRPLGVDHVMDGKREGGVGSLGIFWGPAAVRRAHWSLKRPRLLE